MTRPAVEVADILRAQGSNFIDRHQNAIRFQQLKVMRAIVRCRTAALGGHIDKCSQCGKEWGLSFNSCLMGSQSFWRVARRRAHSQRAIRPFHSPLRFAFQERDQFIRRTKLTFAKARWDYRLNGLEFFAWISPNVDFGCRKIGMPQPQRDLPDISRCLKNNHGAGMPEHVG